MHPNPTGCFVLCCAAGVLSGFLFHLAELPRRRPLAVKALCDLAFCGLCTLVIMLLALTRNGGQLRWFQPLGLLLGIRLYFLGFGVLTRKAAETTGRYLNRFCRKVKQLSIALLSMRNAVKIPPFLRESD